MVWVRTYIISTSYITNRFSPQTSNDFIYLYFFFVARLSKRSLAAVATFMSAGLFSASMCSPMCMWAKFLRTTAADGVRAYFPTELSVFYSAILLAVSCGMTIPLLMPSKSKSGDDASKKGNCDSNSKAPMAVLSAMIFSTGLNISGMTKNYKIYNFLDLKLLQKGGWDPTLICVMGSGLLVSAISYHFVKGHNIFKVSFSHGNQLMNILILLCL